MLKILLIILFVLIGCRDAEYALIYKDPTVVEVEVPVYVEVEVEVGTPTEEVEVWIDSFVQVTAVDGVDIIWVIDRSGSMNIHESNLMAGIEAMMHALPAGGWRLVMISTDPDEAAVENQFPLVTGDDILDAEDMFSLMGTGTEESGFDALYTYIEDNPYSSTWMRHDAALLVVFVSDEDDQSTIMATPNEFLDWYVARRFGNVFLASIVNVDPADTVCTSTYPPDYTGERYMEATSHIFGTVIDICSDDWSAGVNDATVQIEPITTIELTHEPVPETIRVFVSGSLYPDWTYDAARNSVDFSVVPTGGNLVEVGYVIKQ
mgnify:CR=1 FL=1|jgi:hypothetical protein|tara:strand:+ start:2482 stop:3441 length:960 start_codon:yes stop_codon:yes gene_type:complete